MARLTLRETVGGTKGHLEGLNQLSGVGVVYVEEDTGSIKVGDGYNRYLDLVNSTNSNNLFFVDYNDTATATTPITLLQDTWTTLTNDGLGTSTNTSQLPSDLTSMLAPSGGIDISMLKVGSDIMIRPDFTVTPTSNNSALYIRLSLGAGANAYTLESSLGRLDLGAGIPYREALHAIYAYAGDDNTTNNPIDIQIKLSGGGTVVNSGMAIKVYSK